MSKDEQEVQKFDLMQSWADTFFSSVDGMITVQNQLENLPKHCWKLFSYVVDIFFRVLFIYTLDLKETIQDALVNKVAKQFMIELGNKVTVHTVCSLFSIKPEISHVVEDISRSVLTKATSSSMSTWDEVKML